MPKSIPNYLNTSPNGDVTALFSGGVQILAGVSSTPPGEREIRWVQESDGALVAEIGAYSIVPPNTQGGFWRYKRPASSDSTEISHQIGLSLAEIDIAATIGGVSKTARLMTATDRSSFLRCGPSQSPLNEGQRIYGPFQSNTGVIAAQSSGAVLGPFVLPETPTLVLATIVTFSGFNANPYWVITAGASLSGPNLSIVTFNSWGGGNAQAICTVNVIYL